MHTNSTTINCSSKSIEYPRILAWLEQRIVRNNITVLCSVHEYSRNPYPFHSSRSICSIFVSIRITTLRDISEHIYYNRKYIAIAERHSLILILWPKTQWNVIERGTERDCEGRLWPYILYFICIWIQCREQKRKYGSRMNVTYRNLISCWCRHFSVSSHFSSAQCGQMYRYELNVLLFVHNTIKYALTQRSWCLLFHFNSILKQMTWLVSAIRFIYI